MLSPKIDTVRTMLQTKRRWCECRHLTCPPVGLIRDSCPSQGLIVRSLALLDVPFAQQIDVPKWKSLHRSSLDLRYSTVLATQQIDLRHSLGWVAFYPSKNPLLIQSTFECFRFLLYSIAPRSGGIEFARNATCGVSSASWMVQTGTGAHGVVCRTSGKSETLTLLGEGALP